MDKTRTRDLYDTTDKTRTRDQYDPDELVISRLMKQFDLYECMISELYETIKYDKKEFEACLMFLKKEGDTNG